jgi:hypothetical protein
MDLYAVRQIKNKKPVGVFWARGFAGLRGMVAVHCSPELCEAARLLEPVAFVGEGRGVDFKSLTGWQALTSDSESRTFLIRLMQRGKRYYYFRVEGKRTRLPGKPGDKEFEAAYVALFNAESKRREARRTFSAS